MPRFWAAQKHITAVYRIGTPKVDGTGKTFHADVNMIMKEKEKYPGVLEFFSPADKEFKSRFLVPLSLATFLSQWSRARIRLRNSQKCVRIRVEMRTQKCVRRRRAPIQAAKERKNEIRGGPHAGLESHQSKRALNFWGPVAPITRQEREREKERATFPQGQLLWIAGHQTTGN